MRRCTNRPRGSTLSAAVMRVVALTAIVAFASPLPDALASRDAARDHTSARGTDRAFTALRGVRSWAFPGNWPRSALDDGPVATPRTAATISVGAAPVGEALDPATHTLYVANVNDNTVSVINMAVCSATNTIGCNQTPTTVAIGSNPLALAVDQSTHTLYVANAGADYLSMLNTETCNATATGGCTASPTTVTVGSSPGPLAIDPSTNTVYVPNTQGDTVSVLDAATCNATDPSGCGDVSTITVGSGAQAVALDPQTHTGYVANFNDGTVSVINTATCNATVRFGCDQAPPTVAVGAGPDAVVVDQASDTAYVAVGATLSPPALGEVALINGATCNASTARGCSGTPQTTPIGSVPDWITENPVTRTVYAVNEEDSSVSVIDAETCNATDTSGCRPVAPALAIGFNGGAAEVDPSTNTVYATSQNENEVSVLSGAACGAIDTEGCTSFAPVTTVGPAPQGVATNPQTNTIYVTNRNDNSGPSTVSMINAAQCNALHPAGCDRTWPTFQVGHFAQDLRVNRRTDTVYIVNDQDGTVSVINGATCNATDQAGCSDQHTISVGSGPFALAIDESTDTIYVVNNGLAAPGNTVSVINGATCNGTVHHGCDQTPPTVTVGTNPDGIAIDQATDTIYVTNSSDNTVSVVNGASCNGTVHYGCDQNPPTITVGSNPYPITVDQRTNTVYVGNSGDSTMSIINGATCNATTMQGCDQNPATIDVRGLPSGIAISPWTATLYVTSIVDSDVQTLNENTCNATTTRNCQPIPVPLRMGGFGGAIAIDPVVRTAYVPDNVDRTVSLLGTDNR
jgi:YVTN family beta-propeller protein